MTVLTIATIRKKRWMVAEVERFDDPDKLGSCDAPDTPNKKILILDHLSGQERLEVLIHEMLHAAYWDMDETAIHGAAADIAKVLIKLGYSSEP